MPDHGGALTNVSDLSSSHFLQELWEYLYTPLYSIHMLLVLSIQLFYYATNWINTFKILIITESKWKVQECIIGISEQFKRVWVCQGEFIWLKEKYGAVFFWPLASFGLVCNCIYAQEDFLLVKMSSFFHVSFWHIHRKTLLIYVNNHV